LKNPLRGHASPFDGGFKRLVYRGGNFRFFKEVETLLACGLLAVPSTNSGLGRVLVASLSAP
tara:strand:- start:527 stop:712 length:186 start_codon:yes stop_codon:yes gene_type:complete